MAASFFRDDNTETLHDVGGLRPDFAHVARASTSGSITELSLTGNIAANRSERSLVILRVAVIGTNAVYFSLGLAGTAPADNTTMISLPGNSVSFFKATAQDASAYHQQNTGSSSIEIVAMT